MGVLLVVGSWKMGIEKGNIALPSNLFPVQIRVPCYTRLHKLGMILAVLTTLEQVITCY